MDVTEFMESKYVNVDLIENAKKRTGVVLTAGSREETQFGQRFALTVVIDGKIKKYQPNRTSLENITSVWGKISDTWVNSVLIFSIENINGKQTVIAKPFRKVMEDDTQTTENIAQ